MAVCLTGKSASIRLNIVVRPRPKVLAILNRTTLILQQLASQPDHKLTLSTVDPSKQQPAGLTIKVNTVRKVTGFLPSTELHVAIITFASVDRGQIFSVPVTRCLTDKFASIRPNTLVQNSTHIVKVKSMEYTRITNLDAGITFSVLVKFRRI